MKTLIVPAADVPVLLECDVLVCGAGPAGCAAAITAARAGCRTVLLERWSFPGGLGTAGMVNIWHTSDRRREVIHGIVSELAHEAITRGLAQRYDHFPTRHETYEFNPEGMKVVLDDFLAEAGVQPLYTLVAGEVITDGDRVVAVLCDTKAGRRALLARLVIDCTGDGDIAARAGVPWEIGRSGDGLVQGMTLMYQLAGLDVERILKLDHAPGEQWYEASASDYVQQMRKAQERGELPPFGPISFQYYARGGFPNMNPASGNPLDEQDLSRCLVATRQHMHQYVQWWREHVPGFAQAQVAVSASMLGVRESRRCRCLKQLTAEDVLTCRKQPDAIGHGFWMVDIHDPEGSGHTTWEQQQYLPAGESYHIPYGMLVPQGFRNLLIAGRCASATHEALASVRLQSHCMVMGQAAGAAAAQALHRGLAVQDVDVSALQAALRKAGAYLE